MRTTTDTANDMAMYNQKCGRFLRKFFRIISLKIQLKVWHYAIY